MTQKHAAINGAIGGIISSGILFLADIVNKNYLFNPILGFLTTAILIGFILYTIQMYFNQSRELYNFRTAFGYGFITGLVGMLVTIIAQYILYNFIDPELNEMLQERALENMEKMGRFLGEEEMEKAMEKISETDVSFSLKNAAIALGFSLVWPVSIVTLIITIIFNMRRKNL